MWGAVAGHVELEHVWRGALPARVRVMTEPPRRPGYHIREIPRGVLGEPSKIIEEAREFEDATEQGCIVMGLVELADLYGAIRAYAARHGLTMQDLERMADITERAFHNGHRR